MIYNLIILSNVQIKTQVFQKLFFSKIFKSKGQLQVVFNEYQNYKPLKAKFHYFFKIKNICISYLFIYLCFLGPHVGHMEVSRLGVESELQLLACATAAAMQVPSCTCNLYHSSWQCGILNPLSGAGDQTCILTDTSR